MCSKKPICDCNLKSIFIVNIYNLKMNLLAPFTHVVSVIYNEYLKKYGIHKD